MASCWSCDAPLDVEEKVKREATCERCQAWVHACKNCHFWNDSARSCEEPAADWVHDRERANFCDFFTLAAPDPGAGAGKGGKADGRGKPPSGRDAFDKLFKR